MFNIAILLVSEQTLPNCIFVKELGQRAIDIDKYIFISTKKMEEQERSKWIKLSLDLNEKKCETWIVEAESFPEAALVLTEKIASILDAAKIYLNLTGGTKMMSIAAFQCFVNHRGLSAFYMPLGGKIFQEIYPNSIESPITAKVNMKEYLLAYGFNYVSTITEKPETFTQSFFKKVQQVNGIENLHEIKKYYQIGFTSDEKQYYTGGWWEEFIYCLLKQELNLNKSEIALNLILKHLDTNSYTDSDTEIDVAFVHNNMLFVFECKAYINKIDSRKINLSLYKLGAIQTTLGLHANCFLMIPSKKSNIAIGTLNRIALLAKSLRIKEFFGLDEISQIDFIKYLKLT